MYLFHAVTLKSYYTSEIKKKGINNAFHNHAKLQEGISWSFAFVNGASPGQRPAFRGH